MTGDEGKFDGWIITEEQAELMSRGDGSIWSRFAFELFYWENYERLREMAAESGARAKRLLAVHYLITGECYRPSIVCQRIAGTPWCAALRERYHVAACTGMNYARAADGTTDVCLGRLLEEMSSGAYRQADSLLAMLERSMRTETCAPPR